MEENITVICPKNNFTFHNSAHPHKVSLVARPQLQTVPAWVRETLTYQHAVKAGLIVEIPPASAAADTTAHENTSPTPKEEGEKQ